MQFSRPTPRRSTAPALPMINVVFLLLIFFLMSAQIVPPSPFEVVPPEAETKSATEIEDLRIYISSEGEIALGDGDERDPWEVLSAIDTPDEIRVLLRADGDLAATDLANALSRLTALGFGEIDLAVAKR